MPYAIRLRPPWTPREGKIVDFVRPMRSERKMAKFKSCWAVCSSVVLLRPAMFVAGYGGINLSSGGVSKSVVKIQAL
jgi:hypothetical protein